MKEIKATVIINQSAHEVFDYVLNPKNTPKWADSVVTEQVSKIPVGLGTIFRNLDHSGNCREFEITEFQPKITITMSKLHSNLRVKYTLRPINDNQCELEYYVWADTGNLDKSCTKNACLQTIKNLKNIIEKDK